MISGVISLRIWAIAIVSLHITPLIATHEPPSTHVAPRSCYTGWEWILMPFLTYSLITFNRTAAAMDLEFRDVEIRIGALAVFLHTLNP